ncbi:MAG: protein phosphatase 2C domain-containing protein [Trichodesmium sp.]
MPKHYLWGVGEEINGYQPGEIIAGRYQVYHGKILLDTQPEKMPLIPEQIPGAIEAYLKLFPYRLHIPQVFGLVLVTARQNTREIWLLEKGPIHGKLGSLMPAIGTQWKNATPMRQLNWLWQIAQLWQPLNVQKVASSLLDPENLRVEGQLVRLVELHSDKESLTLQNLGKLWQKWVSDANPAVGKFLQQLCQQMIAGEVKNADQVIAQLDRGLEVLGRSQKRIVHIATGTDTGPNRSHNEDACYPPSQTLVSHPPSSQTVAIVCDGIGGQDGGEVASELAIKVLTQELLQIPENGDPLTITTKLEESTAVTNDAIYNRNDDEQRHGRQRMGTTLVMALAHLHQLYITHVGDSRAYWISPHGCYQVTLDDDVATRQVRLAYSLYYEAINQVASGALVQALGITASVALHPTVQRFPIDEDSIFLICSDGLSDKDRVEEYWETEILPLLDGNTNITVIRDRLIEIANTKNGHDNVTVALVHYQVNSPAQVTELSLPPIEVNNSQTRKSLTNSDSSSKLIEKKPKTWLYLNYLLGIFVLLGLGGILAYFLSPIGKELIEPSTTKIADNQVLEETESLTKKTENSTPEPTLSFDVNSYILISNSDSTTETLNKPIELLTNTRENYVQGVVSQGTILKVIRKISESEETWLELEVCSSTKSSTTNQEFIYYLQPKDVGWIQQTKIESRLDIVNLFDITREKLDGCL